MSTTLVGQKQDGNSVKLRKNGKRLVYETSYLYLVEATSVTENRNTVLGTTGLPRPGVTVGPEGFTVCTDLDAQQDVINRKRWNVTATFSSDVQEDTSGATESQSGDPTAWQPVAELQFETYQFYSTADINGVPYANSAGFPFSSGIPLTRRLVQYDFEQFEPSSTKLDDISERNETVNDAQFLGKPAKTLKLTVKKATIGYYYGYRVWRIAYSLTYKKDTWIHKPLDIGPFYLSGANKVAFKTNPPLERPYEGFLTPTGGPSNTPTVKDFDQFEAIDFSAFLRVQD